MSDKMYSYSELRLAQRCPKKYSYARVRNLQRRWPARPRRLGSWLHTLLDAYHCGEDWLEVHAALTAEHRELDLYEELVDLPEQAKAIMQGYVNHYGPPTWKVLHAEESFVASLGEDVEIGFTPDLVVDEGGLWIVDHKSTVSIPDPWDNMDDLQHLTYIAGLRQKYGSDLKGFIFNWIRTKPPTQPRLRKDGKVIDVNRIDTTYDVLRQFAEDNGIEPYPELTEKLAKLHGDTRWFRRDHLIVPDEAVKTTIREVREWWYILEEHNTERVYPRVVLPRSAGTASCKSCEFQPLCRAELLGIDTEGILLSDYEERDPLDRDYVEIEDDA